MRFSWITPLLRNWATLLRSTRIAAFGGGLLGGLCLLDWTHHFAATFGTSLLVVVSTALALAMSCELGWRRPVRNRGPLSDGAHQFAIAQILLAIHTVLFPLLILAARSLAGRIDVQTMAVPIVGLLFLWASAAVLLAFPAYWLVRLPALLHQARTGIVARELTVDAGSKNNTGSSQLSLWGLCGIAVGLLSGVFVMAPLMGAHFTGLTAAACYTVAGISSLIRSQRVRFTEVAQQHNTDAESITIPSATLPRWKPLELTRALAIIACLGAGTALAGRMAHQLMPASGYIIYCEWAAVIGGVAFGAAWGRRTTRRSCDRGSCLDNRMTGWACLAVAAWGSLCLMLYGSLIEMSLAAASSLSVVALLMLVRGLTAIVLVLPYAFGWGAVAALAHPTNTLSPSTNDKSGNVFDHHHVESLFGPPWQFLAWVVGLLSVRWAFAVGADAATLFAGTSLMLAAMSVFCWVSTDAAPRYWAARAIALTAIFLAVSSPWLRGKYDPARSARLLFSTNVFSAYHSGIDHESLPFLDDGRNIAVREGERGTYTLWKHRGTQFHLRESGIPKGMVSAHPGVCPEYSAEVLPAVLSLTLHDDPRRVLLLGMGSSTTLSTCLAFPLESLTCVEGDAALVDVLETVVWPAAGHDPRDDSRVRMVPLDPVMASTCRSGRFDVILSSADPLALWQAEPCYTREYYESAARWLDADGLFAQRFQQFDFGPRPLQTVVKTLRQVFSEVAVIETAPGDLLLLATNSPAGIVRDGALKRFQADQVRLTLSQVGWDWTVPLNLAAWPNSALAEFSGVIRTNTASNGEFAFSIPQEMMRWGNKGQELAAAFAPHASRLLEWENIQGNDPDVLRRLAEVVGQHKLMTDYPDQPWAYRKTLREELKGSPRSLIQQVSHQVLDRGIHPDDKRRLDYFKALGEAAKKKDPTDDDIRKVAEFEAPYDPFVSYFLHQEAAALYARSTQASKEAELAHRLHAIHFGDPRDRSVRDVVDALTLLVKHPEACPSASERWDQMNSLLQVLKTRWETRGSVEPKAPRIVLNDLEKSITAVENTFELMDAQYADAEIKESEWQARRAFLEKSLVRPLRTYRGQLLPYHLQKERQNRNLSQEAAEAAQSAESPPEGIPVLESE